MGPQSDKIIIIAGATGQLGHQITKYVVEGGASVRALVRKGTAFEKTEKLRKLGAQVIELDYRDQAGLVQACVAGSCVVSALSGLRDVIVEAQTQLMQAAITAGVPRFIPSDYCIDYTRLPEGSNRNLDLRREFQQRIDQAPIRATSILNGMFADLLKGDAPLIVKPLKKVIYWGDKDQPLDFTTIRNTAEFTAAAAIDDNAPRFLKCASQVASIEDLRRVASLAFGEEFSTFRVGGLGMLNGMIKIMKTVAPQPTEVFPPWQGMQYMHNMFTGLPKLDRLDNNRYPYIRWTSLQEMLADAEEPDNKNVPA